MPPAKETQGRTEQYVGSWLKGRRREDVILATKVGGAGARRGEAGSSRAAAARRVQVLHCPKPGVQEAAPATTFLRLLPARPPTCMCPLCARLLPPHPAQPTAHPPTHLPSCLTLQVSGYGRQDYLREAGVFPRVTPDQIEYAVDRSLQRLGTDHIDLLQIHW